MVQALDIELKGASEVKISAIWQLSSHTAQHGLKSLQSQKPPKRKSQMPPKRKSLKPPERQSVTVPKNFNNTDTFSGTKYF